MKQTIPVLFQQNAWIVGVVLVAWCSIGSVISISARSRRVKNQPVIRVGIYNYANIARRELLDAERDATALFTMAGVRIVWLEYSHKLLSARIQINDPAPDFSLRLLRTFSINQVQRASGVDVMGESFIPRGTNGPVAGGIANISYDRVKEVASAWGSLSSDVLGETIAHELGHLMLGPQHSRRGVMKPFWTLKDQNLISQRGLRFLPTQAELLQRAARSLHQDSTPMVVALR